MGRNKTRRWNFHLRVNNCQPWSPFTFYHNMQVVSYIRLLLGLILKNSSAIIPLVVMWTSSHVSMVRQYCHVRVFVLEAATPHMSVTISMKKQRKTRCGVHTQLSSSAALCRLAKQIEIRKRHHDDTINIGIKELWRSTQVWKICLTKQAFPLKILLCFEQLAP